jgi:hypothetical protein
MGLFKRRAPRAEVPPAVVAALELAKGERVLAFGVDDNTGAFVVATTFCLAVVSLAVVESAVVTSNVAPATAKTSTAKTSTAGSSTAETSTAETSTVTPATARTSTAKTSTAMPATAATATAATATVVRTLRRRWLSVDAGAWEPETATLTVTWAEGGRGAQWSFRDQETLLPETLRERVQASVVIATRLTLGDRRNGRVAIRQDFATRELISQTILGRYTRADDPEVQAHVQAALAHLRDQVGLPA